MLAARAAAPAFRRSESTNPPSRSRPRAITSRLAVQDRHTCVLAAATPKSHPRGQGHPRLLQCPHTEVPEDSPVADTSK